MDKDAIIKKLHAKYPGQCIGDFKDDGQMASMLSWISILEYARAGDFDAIRPDILVNHWVALEGINRHH